ncbi:substrate-binding periplasmic protein [Roseibium alexandrii]
MKVFLVTLFAYLFVCSPEAKSVERFVTSEFPPYVIFENGSISGIIPEIVEAAGQRLGKPISVEIVPWSRAQILVNASGGSVATGPLIRTCDRESNFTWLTPLPEVSSEFVLLARDPALLGLAEPVFKKLRVGLLGGTAYKKDVKSAGFNNIIEVETEVQNGKMLALGRTDLWASPRVVAERIYVELGHDISDLYVATTLRNEVMFLVTSKVADEVLLAAWRGAMSQIRQDGTLKRIVSKYQSDSTIDRLVKRPGC